VIVELSLAGNNLKKLFNWRVIFRDISFEVVRGQTLLITGRNGSGKSTLVKMISGVLTPTSGTVTIHRAGDGKKEGDPDLLGLVSPYLQMYDEFSARENIQYALSIRGRKTDEPWIDELMKRVGLFERQHDAVRTYSSGMKQRVKYAFALCHRPPVLLLDEPMANLDSDGIAIVRNIMSMQRNEGILVVATNDLTDIDRYDLRVDLNATS
jgi:heme exporter protein A